MDQILISKVSYFFNRNTDYLKLSDFYNSQSTKYASCLDSFNMFEKITDKETIIKLGFDRRVKTVLHINRDNPTIKNIYLMLTAQKNAENEARKASEKKFFEMVLKAKEILSSNPEMFTKYKVKAVGKFQNFNSRAQQYTTWKMSTKFPDVTKTAFFHAISKI